MDTTQERRRQRRYTPAFRRQVVEETLAGGESVSVVARRHDLNANLLFTWRRRYRQGTLADAAENSEVEWRLESASRVRWIDDEPVLGSRRAAADNEVQARIGALHHAQNGL